MTVCTDNFCLSTMYYPYFRSRRFYYKCSTANCKSCFNNIGIAFC